MYEIMMLSVFAEHQKLRQAEHETRARNWALVREARAQSRAAQAPAPARGRRTLILRLANSLGLF